VQPPRRARRVPDPDLCVVLHELNLTHVGRGRAASTVWVAPSIGPGVEHRGYPGRG
jgi:hypothetical protein